jgi:predicted house-cleaning noncanonical NTP pyrophosphatase (MazG superfamily)
MKNIRQLFRNKEDLLDEPEVEQLLEYCEQLQDEIVEFNYEKANDKKLIMLDMIKEIVKACNEIEKQQQEAIRFGLESPDFEAGISNLKKYLIVQCRDNKIWI